MRPARSRISTWMDVYCMKASWPGKGTSPRLLSEYLPQLADVSRVVAFMPQRSPQNLARRPNLPFTGHDAFVRSECRKLSEEVIPYFRQPLKGRLRNLLLREGKAKTIQIPPLRPAHMPQNAGDGPALAGKRHLELIGGQSLHAGEEVGPCQGKQGNESREFLFTQCWSIGGKKRVDLVIPFGDPGADVLFSGRRAIWRGALHSVRRAPHLIALHGRGHAIQRLRGVSTRREAARECENVGNPIPFHLLAADRVTQRDSSRCSATQSVTWSAAKDMRLLPAACPSGEVMACRTASGLSKKNSWTRCKSTGPVAPPVTRVTATRRRPGTFSILGTNS